MAHRPENRVLAGVHEVFFYKFLPEKINLNRNSALKSRFSASKSLKHHVLFLWSVGTLETVGTPNHVKFN
jgi:hypothetical protein